jgi:hypothetical protein
VAIGKKFESGELTNAKMMALERSGEWKPTYRISVRRMREYNRADPDNGGQPTWKRLELLPPSSAPTTGPPVLLGAADRVLAFIVVMMARAGQPFQRQDIVDMARWIAISLHKVCVHTGELYNEHSCLTGWYRDVL